MSALPKHSEPISKEDHLTGVRLSELRHEYIDRQVYAMGGAGARHGLILNALVPALTPHNREKILAYQTLSCLLECALTAQDMPHVEIYRQKLARRNRQRRGFFTSTTLISI